MGNQVRSAAPLSVGAHLATTRHAPSFYPFQAEAPLPQVGPAMGIDLLSGGAFSFDPFALYAERIITNPNLLVLGPLGTGKSTLAKLLCWGLSALCGPVEIDVTVGSREAAQAMRARLQKQLAAVSRDLANLEGRLRSVEFTEKAPAEVVAADRQRRDELSARRATLERYLGGLEE